jgi:hypothetical protein
MAANIRFRCPNCGSKVLLMRGVGKSANKAQCAGCRTWSSNTLYIQAPDGSWALLNGDGEPPRRIEPKPPPTERP